MSPSIIVIDDFYPRPQAIRKKALAMDFVEPDDIVGWRTVEGYFPNNFITLLEKKSGLNIKSIQMPQGTPHDNGVYFLSHNGGSKKEVPGVHWDLPTTDMLCLVYLTENIPIECGTSFYKHKKTGLENAPTLRDAKRLNQSKESLANKIESDGCITNCFIEIDRVGYKFNRAIIFPCKRLHAATNHYGKNIKLGRLYQVFTFKIN